MKIILTLILCSLPQGECMTPYQWPTPFNSTYDCLMFGYEESMRKLEEIGRSDVNEHGIFIRFVCSPLPEA